MNNENKMTETSDVTAEKLPVYKNRRILILLSAILAALILLNAAMIVILAVRSGSSDTETDGGTVTELYTYNKGDIYKYLPGFTASTVSGLVVPGKEYKVDDITDEAIREYIDSLILSKATASNGGKLNKTEAVDYGDVVYLYVLYVEKDGEDIGIDYFNSAYSLLNGYRIGSAQFGKSFDEALMGMIPANMGYTEFDAMGTIDEDDVICLTYTATIDGKEDAAKKLSGERMDLAKADEAMKAAILANCKAIGQEFKFDLTLDINEDGTEELVHYVATVDSVAHEYNVTKLSATLPDDFFGSSMEEEYTSLNGQTLDFYLSVSHSIAYENSYEVEVEVTEDGENGPVTKKVKEKRYIECFDDLTLDFIVNKLGHGFSVEPKGDTVEAKNADARAKYFEDVKKTQTENYDANVKDTSTGVIWNEILETVVFDSLPEALVSDTARSQIEEFEYYYNYYYSTDSTFVLTFASIEEYAYYYYGYTAEEYEKYTDYINEEWAPKTVKQTLLAYAIAYELGLKDNAEKYNAIYDRYIKELQDSAKEQKYDLSREEAIQWFADNYGPTYLDEMTIAELANDYIFENNQVDWELSSEKAE